MAFEERLAIFVEANVKHAVAEFKKVGDAASKAGTSADTSAKATAKAWGSALLKKGLAVGFVGAGAAIAKFGVDSVQAFQKVTGEVRAFQRITGASAEDASKFVAVFRGLGMDVDTAGAAIFKLSSRIGTSNKAFADSGVVIAHTKSGTVDLIGTILNVGDAYKKTSDQTKKAEIVVAAFGSKQGMALLPLLGKTRAELEAIIKTAEGRGLIFTQEQLDKSKEYAVATRALGESFKAVQVAAGEELIPFLTELAVVITKVIDASQGEIGKGLKGLALLAAGTLGPSVFFAGKALKQFAGDEGDAARAAAEASLAVDDQAKAFDALKKAIFGGEEAQRSYEAAGRAVGAADRTLATARKDLNELMKEGAVDEENVAAARISLAEATRSLADANRGVAKAQREYDEAVAYAAAVGGLDSALDLVADAGENLADAQDTQTSASERARQAADDLAKAQAGDPEFQDKLAAARQGVADATQGVADATYNLGKRSFENVAAHDAEALAIGGKATEVDRLRTELEDLLRLNPGMFGFIAPILAGLPSAGGGGMSGGVVAPPPAPLSAPVNNGGGGDFGPTNTVQRIGDTVINVTEAVIDPVGFARKVIWNLN